MIASLNNLTVADFRALDEAAAVTCGFEITALTGDRIEIRAEES